jgi:hypothetical protein
VLVGGQLLLLHQRVHGFVLPDGVVAFDQVEHPGRQHEEAAIDEAAVAQGLFGEGLHLVAGDIQRAEAPGRRTAATVASLPQAWWKAISALMSMSARRRRR